MNAAPESNEVDDFQRNFDRWVFAGAPNAAAGRKRMEAQARLLDEQAPHSELYSIPLVSGNAAFPQRFGHDAEHRAAIEFLSASLNRVDRESADFPAFDERSWGGHAVVSRVTRRRRC